MEFKINEKDLLEYKRKRYARYLTNYALKTGQIQKPCVCELCKKADKPITAHHIDYGKPLDITWLCTACHGLAHRKHSKLNPKNNKQTFLPNMHEKFETVSVNITLPIEVFCAIKNKSNKSGSPVAKIIKELVIHNYPIEEKQLKFKFMENENHDNTQNEQNKGIYIMENDVGFSEKSRSHKIQKFWGERHKDLPSLGKGLFRVFEGHGENTSFKKRPRVN